eukprot:gene2424-2910_t
MATNYSRLYSVVVPFNDVFSHAFTTGAAMLAYMVPNLVGDPSARVLVPDRGPLQTLVESMGVNPSQIVPVPTGSKQLLSLYASPRATLILRKPPFNLIQAHWPAGGLNHYRNVTVNWLIRNGYVNGSQLHHQNKIVYLWRSGQRNVFQQDRLGRRYVDEIREALYPGYELVVVGREKKVQYGSPEERTAWLYTAELFI